jgi:hypothetical protein
MAVARRRGRLLVARGKCGVRTDRGGKTAKPKEDRGSKRFQIPMKLESFSQILIGQNTRPSPFGRGDKSASSLLLPCSTQKPAYYNKYLTGHRVLNDFKGFLSSFVTPDRGGWTRSLTRVAPHTSGDKKILPSASVHIPWRGILVRGDRH